MTTQPLQAKYTNTVFVMASPVPVPDEAAARRYWALPEKTTPDRFIVRHTDEDGRPWLLSYSEATVRGLIDRHGFDGAGTVALMRANPYAPVSLDDQTYIYYQP